MKPINLPATHYAFSWPADVQHKPEELTQMGLEYATAPTDEKLLEIIRSFHGYLLKYMGMILQGHVSFRGGQVNKDTQSFLQHFIGKAEPVNRVTLGTSCRTLHLAFKEMDQAEVYDQLMMCLVRAIKRYDPSYNEKVKQVVALVNEEFHGKKFVLTINITNGVGYDSTRYLRLLNKRGFLVPLTREATVVGYKPTAAWPPPADFLNAKPVGLSYFVSKWFRYFLTDWINWRMGELEAKEGVLQLDHRSNASPKRPRSGENVWDPAIPHADGDYTIPHSGKSVAADVSLASLPVDVGVLTLEWVNLKSDGIFGGLSQEDRHLLYCVFSREMDWNDIAKDYHISLRRVKKWYNTVIDKLKKRSKWPLTIR